MQKSTVETMFSSKSPEWSTPSDFFQTYNSIYHFNLDPACTHANAKCEKHYTIAEDGLKQNWGGVGYGSIPHTAERSGSGYRKPIRKDKRRIPLWYAYSRPGQIRHGFMTTVNGAELSLSEDD